MLRGVFPIVATPFTQAGDVDEQALRRVVRFCIDCGVHGLVWPAVASEFYTLTDEERVTYLKSVVAETAGRLPIIVGVSAPSKESAAIFARSAAESGAAAVMALPPFVVKDDLQGAIQYYQTISRAAEGLPIILQNADAPLGQGFSSALIARLVDAVPGLAYVKEETARSGYALTRTLRETGDRLQGVFGGAGGRYLIEEYLRGACGAMPACEFSDVFVTLWEHLEQERLDEARSLFERLLPLLMMQAPLRMAFTKEVLRRRGVIESTLVRVSGGVAPDDVDLQEIGALMERLAQRT